MPGSYQPTLDEFPKKIATSVNELKRSYATYSKNQNPTGKQKNLEDIANLIKGLKKINIDLKKLLREKLSTVTSYIDKIDIIKLNTFNEDITEENVEEFLQFLQHCQIRNIAELLSTLKNFRRALEDLQLPFQIDDIKSWDWESLFNYQNTSYWQSLDEKAKQDILSYKIEPYLSPLSELTELFSGEWSENFKVIEKVIPLLEQTTAYAIQHDNTNIFSILGDNLLSLTETWNQHNFLLYAILSEFPADKVMGYYLRHFLKKTDERDISDIICLEDINEYLKSPELHFLVFKKKYRSHEINTQYIKLLNDKISFLLSRGGNFTAVPLYEEYPYIENFFNAVNSKKIGLVKDMLCNAKKSNYLDTLLNTVNENSDNIFRIAADPTTGDKNILHLLTFYGSFLTFKTPATEIIWKKEKENVASVKFFEFFKRKILANPQGVLGLVEKNLEHLKCGLINTK